MYLRPNPSLLIGPQSTTSGTRIREQDPERSVLTEAQGLVHGDRQDQYGHPLDDYERNALIWTAILGDKLKEGEVISPKDAALCMVGIKLSREVHRPKRDNLVDLAGYAEVASMIQRQSDIEESSE